MKAGLHPLTTLPAPRTSPPRAPIPAPSPTDATPRALRLPAWRFGPIVRISVGLVALLVSLVLLAELLFKVLPDDDAAALQHTRLRVAHNLAQQSVALLEAGNDRLLGQTLQQVIAGDADLRSVAIRRSDGSLLLRRGAPTAGTAGDAAEVPRDRVRLPIQAGARVWGEIELRFAPSSAAAASPGATGRWLPGVPAGLQLVGALALAAFALFYLYLRRAMQYLNPSASVPDRVRKAFDSLTEGLLIIDQQSRIVLANRAFRSLHPQADQALNGQRIDSLAWLGGGRPDAMPWAQTLASAAAVSGWPLALPQAGGGATQLMVSSAPITDDRGRARGCLITFDNVTAVHRANEELRATLGELEKSRQRIEEQNVELRRLASRDPLTGCLNRRAFFDGSGALFDAARRSQRPLCVLMVDIDHFKQFNDRYGHAVGDQVIQAVARALAAALRQADVLCRYGGEEFCIVLPDTAPQAAAAVAERIRAEIEANAAAAIRSSELTTVTASFGLASAALGARTLEALIDQADQALYESKRQGRNRVTQWR